MQQEWKNSPGYKVRYKQCWAKKKQQMLQLSWFDWNTAILLQTQADSFPQTFTLSKRTKKTIYAAAFFFCRETMQMSHLGTAAAI